jgi:hypothetical protein
MLSQMGLNVSLLADFYRVGINLTCCLTFCLQLFQRAIAQSGTALTPWGKVQHNVPKQHV